MNMEKLYLKLFNFRYFHFIRKFDFRYHKMNIILHKKVTVFTVICLVKNFVNFNFQEYYKHFFHHRSEYTFTKLIYYTWKYCDKSIQTCLFFKKFIVNKYIFWNNWD